MTDSGEIEGLLAVPSFASWDQYDMDVLRSADEDGFVQAWETRPWFHGLSRLIGMDLKGWLKREHGREGGRWQITDSGRAALNPTAAQPGMGER